MPSANRVNKKDPTLIKADLPIYEGYQDADELAAAQEREVSHEGRTFNFFRLLFVIR